MKLNFANFVGTTAFDAIVVYSLERNLRELSEKLDLVQPLEKVFVDATTAPVTHTLASGWTNDLDHYIVKTDASANAVTITAPAGESIGGGSIILAAQYDKAILTFYKGVWYRLS